MKIQKPAWIADESDEESESALPPDAVMPGKMRNIGLPLNYHPENQPSRTYGTCECQSGIFGA